MANIWNYQVGDVLTNNGKKYLVVSYFDYNAWRGFDNKSMRLFTLINDKGKRVFLDSPVLVFSKPVGHLVEEVMKDILSGIDLRDESDFRQEDYYGEASEAYHDRAQMAHEGYNEEEIEHWDIEQRKRLDAMEQKANECEKTYNRWLKAHGGITPECFAATLLKGGDE